MTWPLLFSVNYQIKLNLDIKHLISGGGGGNGRNRNQTIICKPKSYKDNVWKIFYRKYFCQRVTKKSFFHPPTQDQLDLPYHLALFYMFLTSCFKTHESLSTFSSTLLNVILLRHNTIIKKDSYKKNVYQLEPKLYRLCIWPPSIFSSIFEDAKRLKATIVRMLFSDQKSIKLESYLFP